ncbi:MAG: phosphoribosyltransferase [Caldilineae bacterium]|nr:MAG: phosphoribosyltransferase [Caldilineae bacterium]
MKKIYLSWQEVEALILRLIPKLKEEHFDAVLAITRGGIIPGGLIAERLGVPKVLVASVDFYSDEEHNLDLPVFMQFPGDNLLRGEHVLVVDDLWDRGREVSSVKERVEMAGGKATTFVMHYKPHRSLYPDTGPDYYTAITEDWIIYPWELSRAGYGMG